MNCQLYIFDCLTGKLRVSDSDFMTVGKGRKCTFRVMMRPEEGGVFAQRNGFCRFFPGNSVKNYSINGTQQEADFFVKQDTHYLCVMEGGCFIVWYGDEDSRPDFSQFNPQSWYIYTPEKHEWSSSLSLAELPNHPEADNPQALVTFDGLGYYAFRLSDVLQVAEFLTDADTPLPQMAPTRPQAQSIYRCPSCWCTFENQQAVYIATHNSLIGDEKLGPDEMQRFTPETPPEGDVALDSRGGRCRERACPNCHHKLPPFFGQMCQHIFSLIGVSSAGKSYYLSALVHELEKTMSRDFGIPFRDADPTANAPLNDMRMRVFTADTPQDAHIGKTHLRGRLYRRVWNNGEYARMPRPFIYTLNKGERAHSVVLYDNAGENYEPGQNSSQMCGADHLKVADALLFLFDPTTNPGFRALLQDSPDPQLQNCLAPPGRQALLLAETEMRLRTSLNLPPDKRVSTPLAVIIGKHDAWRSLLGPEPLLPVVRNGQIKEDNIAANSARLRELLFSISPNICANAEAVSSNVRYFAASSLGAPPCTFRDEITGEMLLGPADGKMHPFRVTDAFLWALSCVAPTLLPGNNG